MDAVKLDGIVPIIPVPFTADESIDEPGLRRVVDYAVAHGAAGACLPAYGSEFYKLSDAERERVVGIAIEANRRRVPLIAQANHGAAKVAAATAQRYERMGADLISIAIPRTFGLNDADVARYLGRVAGAVGLPLLVQDFNPGGPTIGAEQIDALNRAYPNIRYVKLEEPLMADKLIAIRARVGERVGVLEGWGGYYLLELIPHGICGAMPGTPLVGPLTRVYRLRASGQDRAALELMGRLLPFINFSLQHFEVFLHIEKTLLARLGVIEHATVRDATYVPSAANRAYAEFLIGHVLDLIREVEGQV